MFITSAHESSASNRSHAERSDLLGTLQGAAKEEDPEHRRAGRRLRSWCGGKRAGHRERAARAREQWCELTLQSQAEAGSCEPPMCWQDLGSCS